MKQFVNIWNRVDKPNSGLYFVFRYLIRKTRTVRFANNKEFQWKRSAGRKVPSNFEKEGDVSFCEVSRCDQAYKLRCLWNFQLLANFAPKVLFICTIEEVGINALIENA